MAHDDFSFPSGTPEGSIPFGLFSTDQGDEDSTEVLEKLTISSRRATPAILSFERTHEYNPERDALMLRAFLSTTVDDTTWSFFVRDIVMNSPISHQIIQSMMANPALMTMMGGHRSATTTPKKPRARRRLIKPKENPES